MFRLAQLSDSPQIASLVNSVYRGEKAKTSWSSEAHILGGQRTDPQMIEELITAPNSFILLWEKQGSSQLQACVHLTINQNASHLGMLSVEIESQNKGLGKIVLQESEFFLKQKNCDFLEIEVISCRSELIAYYQRRGFLLTQQAKPFPYGNLRFGQPKDNKLEFVVMQKKL